MDGKLRARGATAFYVSRIQSHLADEKQPDLNITSYMEIKERGVSNKSNTEDGYINNDEYQVGTLYNLCNREAFCKGVTSVIQHWADPGRFFGGLRLFAMVKTTFD